MKKILILSIVGGALLLCIPIIFEPEIVKSQEVDTGDAVVSLTVETGIALGVPATADLVLNQPSNMGSAVNKVTNTVDGAAWTVTTNSSGGWKLEFNTATTDCLYDSGTGARFTDYSEDSEGTPEVWLINESESYQFGFNVEGTYITGSWGTGDACYDGGTTIPTNKSYIGFNSTNKIQVGNDGSETSPDGTDIIMCLAAQQKDVYAPSGSYECTVTGTATTVE